MEKQFSGLKKKNKENPPEPVWLQKLNYPRFLYPLNQYSLRINVAVFLYQLYAKNAAEYNWGAWDLMP